ncbi:serine/threonine protein kinase [Ketobacter sp.]|uniref:serine/threonine protein kinase n=1 Tax=Ketobacter sp. TaxID=2083498 RepID=UPI000F2BFB9C|nr:protein kinase [Ketobacter sp.]RLT92604.1 MAG: serine/threonine protein kinase [Ketobacter sp.]
MELEGFSQLEKIAEGGMAVLYRGIQSSLGRPVAIKVMKGALQGTPEAHEMFEWESRIVARLDHPHIIRVIDRGLTSDEMPYFVMDYVEGLTLKDALKNKKLSDRRKLRIIMQVAKALGYAHKNNVIHRDIKPGNILLDREGNARVVDFGIARLSEDTEVSTIKEEGMTVGTPAYMAPEQKRGASFTSSASDIYSLGIIMYLMLANKLPKAGYPPPSHFNPKIPSSLDKITMACLAEDPDRRPSADKLVALLLKALKGAHLNQEQKVEAQETFKDPKEKFRLLDVIRETRFGSVCLYENRQDHSLMVLKKRIGNFNGYNESEILSRIKHRNIINVRGVSRNDRLFITILEYLPGGSLQSRMANPMPVDEFTVVADQICDAMAFAHSNRIVHGNLRPHNILFDDTNTVKVMDFGFEPHYVETEEENWYKAPGESPSAQSDVFAAGVIFYQLLTGSLPEWKRGLLQPCAAFSEIPQNLRTVIKAMLCLETHVRVQSFEEVKHALHLKDVAGPPKDKTKIQTAPRKGRKHGPLRTLALAAALVLLLGVNGALYFWIYVKKSGDSAGATALQIQPPSEEPEFRFQKVDRSKPN